MGHWLHRIEVLAGNHPSLDCLVIVERSESFRTSKYSTITLTVIIIYTCDVIPTVIWWWLARWWWSTCCFEMFWMDSRDSKTPWFINSIHNHILWYFFWPWKTITNTAVTILMFPLFTVIFYSCSSEIFNASLQNEETKETWVQTHANSQFIWMVNS